MVDWNPEWEPPNLHRQQDRLASFPCIQENTSGALGDSAEIHGTESTFTSLRSSGLQFAPNSSPVFNFSELSRWNGTPPPAIPQTTPNITFSEHCPYPEPGFDIQESYERRESPKHFSTVSHDVLPTFMPFYDNSLPSPSFSPPNVESLGNTSESPSIWYGDVSGLNIPDDPFSAPSQSPTAAPSGAQMPYALDSHFISAVPPFHAREMHPRDDTQTSSFSKLSYDNSDGDYFSNIGLPEGTLRSQHPRARDSDALPISAPITGSVSPIAAPSSEHSCGGPFDVAATSIQGYLYPSSSTSALSFHSDENNQDHDGRPLTWDDGIITPTRNMLDFTLIVHHSTNHEESPLVLEQTEEYEGIRSMPAIYLILNFAFFINSPRRPAWDFQAIRVIGRVHGPFTMIRLLGTDQ
ncbi:hypothetical protein FB451DRAFT_622998 [Mycena latifolia]|nr:hypothetical protein FB451DRAFT_622998 [Mycena latifolia]